MRLQSTKPRNNKEKKEKYAALKFNIVFISMKKEKGHFSSLLSCQKLHIDLGLGLQSSCQKRFQYNQRTGVKCACFGVQKYI